VTFGPEKKEKSKSTKSDFWSVEKGKVLKLKKWLLVRDDHKY